MSYRRISQREARSLKKERDALRSFVDDLRWARNTRVHIGDGLELTTYGKGRLDGARAVENDAILILTPSGATFSAYLCLPPKGAKP